MGPGADAPRRTTLPPTAIGGFEIVGPLGRGGMGVVYRARDPRTGRGVALKTVTWAGEGALAALRREILALSAIRHPGVVAIVAEGIASDRPWYAMELIEGRSLRAVLAAHWRGAAGSAPIVLATDATLAPRPAGDGPAVDAADDGDAADELPPPSPDAPPIADLARWLEPFARLCAPLAQIHAAGIVHRDLSPDNVIVRPDGAPVLVDFGLASAFRRGGREALSIGGTIVGTTHYMAPEQVRGEVVDARADLYALGCMIYEAVTGRPPFAGASPHAVLAHHLYDQPLPPSAHDPALPAWLDGLVLALLAKAPRDRIGYAQDVAAILAEHGVAVDVPARGHPYVYRARLIGRDDLLARFEPVLAGLHDGHGAVVDLAGASGVGKTRLAVELATRAAAEGVRVIAAECVAVATDRSGRHQARTAPLAPLRPLLQAVADRCVEQGPATTARLLGDRAAVLAAYAASIRHLPGVASLPPPPLLSVEGTRARLFHALRETLCALAADGPLLLLLDDVQWADELTLRFLASLSPELLAHTPLALLLTRRTEVAQPLATALAARPDAVAIAVGELAGAEVRAMVGDMLALHEVPAPLFGTLAAQAGGVPFHVGEYLRAAVDDGVLTRRPGGAWTLASDDAALPGSLGELLRHRLERLGPLGRAVARQAAVLGREFDPALLAAVLGVDAAAIDDAVRELVRRHIFEESGRGSLRFGHDKIREAAYADLAAADRLRAHRDVARALEQRAGSGSHELYPELAHHWSMADEPARAIEFLEKAGERGLAMGAYQDTIDFLSRALSLAERVDVTRQRRGRWQRWLGEAAWGLGDVDACGAHVTAALAALDRPLPTSRGGWLRVAGHHLAAQAWRGVARPLPVDDGAGDAALAAARLSFRHYHAGDNLAMVALNLRAVALADRAPGDAPVAQPYQQLGYLAGLARMPGVARRYFAAARARATATADDANLAVTMYSEAIYQLGEGHSSEALRAADAALAVLRRIGHLHELEVALTVTAHAEHNLGHYRRALARCQELYDTSRERANRMHEAWGAYTCARELVALGQPDDAVALCAHAAPLAREAGDHASLILMGGVRALAEWRRGARAEAAAAIDAWLALVDGAVPGVWSLGHGYAAAARAAVELCAVDGGAAARRRARAAISQLWRHAAVFPVGRAAALACEAELALHDRRPALARWLADAARARAQALALPAEERAALRVLVALGADAQRPALAAVERRLAGG
ncbi:MAG: protein kinase [Myxococcales bacterium]|nr:protein kinase [Myxococcales bacterium]